MACAYLYLSRLDYPASNDDRLNYRAKSLEEFDKITKSAPEISYYYYWQGCAFYDYGDYINSEASLKQAIAKEDLSIYHFWLGCAYLGQKDYNDAISEYNTALGVSTATQNQGHTNTSYEQRASKLIFLYVSDVGKQGLPGVGVSGS